MQYLIQGKTLKENIVIKKEIESNTFTFNLSLKNLIPEIKDSSIIFLDKKTKEEVFKVLAPVMYDANGETSNDVKIDIEENKKGYSLIVTPNKDWINSGNRKYPIVIDPAVTSSLNQNDIIDTFVGQNDPENKSSNLFIRVGNVPNVGTTETYLKFKNLPKLKTGDMVINSQLYLGKQSAYSGTDGAIEAHLVLDPWNDYSLTWANRPKIEYKITDTQKVSGSWYSWDITSMAKYWYSSGVNNGLMLKRTDPTSGHTAFLSSDTTSDYSGGWPSVVISYINNSGLENYWTYHSQSVGRSGTGYINDYNGNLIFTHDDMNTTGSKMPISVKHIYNSNDKDSSIGYGLGWRTNLNQRILEEKINETQYYIYIDDDGTRHYFYYDATSSSYKNEEGLELTFTKNSDGSYNIKDKEGIDLYFVPGGYLHKITDKNSNTAYVWYNGTTLSRVIDGAGRTTTFESTSQGYLLAITDPAGRKTQFGYNGIQLSTIVYPDGNRTNYYYNSNNNLQSVVNYDGSKLTYEYYIASPFRTKKVSQFGSDGASAGTLNINYGFNETTFTDIKGRTETYQFNNIGNTVAITDPNGNAEAYKYADKGSRNVNKLEVASKLQKNTRNYLKNHSGETLNNGWYVDYWGSTTRGSGAYSTESAYFGSNSLKISKTEYEDRLYFSQGLNLTKGKTYVFSGYVKTNGVTNDKKKGATLFINYQDGNGVWQTAEGSYVTGTKDWERSSVTFTLPSDAVSTQVYARTGIVEEKGVAYFDALQLEEGTLDGRYNLLENADFDYGDVSSEKWSYNMSDSKGFATTFENRSSFRIKGDLLKNKEISQYVKTGGKAGDSFVLSGWAKADSLPKQSSTNRYFALDLRIDLADGSTQWEVVDFNYDSGSWQFTSGRAVAKGDYTGVNFYALYQNEENYVWFDNLQLYKEEYGQSYQYDSKGNVVSSVDLAKQKSTFEYNGNNDLVKALDPKGNEYKYDYDDKRNIKTATSAENVVYSFEYDSSGNATKTKISGASLFIESIAKYTQNENYISSITDPLGNTVGFNYDANKGTLSTSTDAKGNVTTNGYDINDRLTSVTKKADGVDITNTYSYKNDRIETIGHNGFRYNFIYDSIGRNTGVDVGNQRLITNTYEPNGGNLLESTYGNGAKVQTDYDNLDRVISKKVNGVEIEHYTYDPSGNLGLVEDKVNNITYRYTYDLANRLVKVTDSRGNSYKNEYDLNNNVNKQVNTINGQKRETGFEFDKDNKIKKLTFNNGSNFIKYDYDEIARNKGKILNLGNNITYTTTMEYLPGVNGSATTKVGTLNNNGSQIKYTYDKNGNIETIVENGKIIKYQYNELNELKREDNEALGKTILYDYDAGGNITSKREYAYTTSITGAEISNIGYGYGDSNWKDKLTSYNGKEITYDQIGNLLTYDGYTFTWERGRTLSQIVGNNKNISYKYDSSGIRTEKNVNGVVSKYTLQGDKVVYEEVTNERYEDVTAGSNADKIYYTYDESNNLVSMSIAQPKNTLGGNNEIGILEPQLNSNASIIDVQLPQGGFSQKAIKLSGGVYCPQANSKLLNLKANTKYSLEFDYWADVDNVKFDVDLYPDDLPQRNPIANKDLQHFRWEFTSPSNNMSNSYLRFFNDFYAINPGNIYITNIKLHEYIEPNLVGDISGIGLVDPQFNSGASIVDAIVPQMQFSQKAIRLNGGVYCPQINSKPLSLKVNSKYVVEFDYWADADNVKFDIDLYPDDLPQKLPIANKKLQHYRWEFTSASNNMSNTYLRFFNDCYQINPSNIYITNIKLYELDTNNEEYVNYYYVRSLQGDIIGLIDKNGSRVVSYTYDTWGKLISIDGTLKDTVGVKNPYRYRGYRYDTETGLYYLNSRYYNPEWGRFINIDAYIGTVGELLSCNMFAYCNNNPVNMLDTNGEAGIPIVFGFLEAITYVAEAVVAVISSPIVAWVALGAAVGLTLYAGYQYCKSHSTESSSVVDDDASVPVGEESGPYSHLEDPPNVAEGKDFTPSQKKKIIEENKKRNGGEVKSDDPSDPYSNLVKPSKSAKGVTPSANEWQIDHVIPKSKGGTNSYNNARVISRYKNRLKWDN